MQLLPGDIILYAREGNGLFDIIFRWAAGKWGHASIYWSYSAGKYLVVEAIGRGVLSRDIMADAGREVVVLRLRNDTGNRLGRKAAAIARTIADDPDAWYDLFGLMRFLIPKLLLSKIGLKIGLNYKPDKRFWCSELIAEAYRRAGIAIWDVQLPPSPTDLFNSPALTVVMKGRIPYLWKLS